MRLVAFVTNKLGDDGQKTDISAGERCWEARQVGAGSEGGGSAGAGLENVAVARHESFDRDGG